MVSPDYLQQAVALNRVYMASICPMPSGFLTARWSGDRFQVQENKLIREVASNHLRSLIHFTRGNMCWCLNTWKSACESLAGLAGCIGLPCGSTGRDVLNPIFTDT